MTPCDIVFETNRYGNRGSVGGTIEIELSLEREMAGECLFLGSLLYNLRAHIFGFLYEVME